MQEKENEIKKLRLNGNNNVNQIKNFYENEIQRLKKENNDLNNKIKTLEINKNKVLCALKAELEIKNNTINKLANSLNELKDRKNQFDLKERENLMTIIFQSIDESIHYAIICKKTDRFEAIENILYDKYPIYLDKKNNFTVNGKNINKSKTMEENKIKYSDIIILNKYDM